MFILHHTRNSVNSDDRLIIYVIFEDRLLVLFIQYYKLFNDEGIRL